MKLLAVIIIGVLFLDHFRSSEAWWWVKPKPDPPSCKAPSTKKEKWNNHWDKRLTFICPLGQAMTEIHSLYSNCHLDRVFRFACRKNMVAKGRCHWSHYVNNFDELVSFKCPLSGFIIGISSYHDNGTEDRRFRFRCCTDHRFIRYHCSSNTDYVNDWKKPFNFKAPQNHFLVGAVSFHNNYQEDRRWKFETCKVGRSTHDN